MMSVKPVTDKHVAKMLMPGVPVLSGHSGHINANCRRLYLFDTVRACTTCIEATSQPNTNVPHIHSEVISIARCRAICFSSVLELGIVLSLLR